MTESTNSNMLMLSIPVADVLSWFGKRVDHRGYMYFSPFRDEAEPSMRVTVNPSNGSWLWADFGGVAGPGKKVDGGGCLDLVMRLGGYSSRKEAFDELRKIASSRGINVIEQEVISSLKSARPAGIVLDDASLGFSRRSLVRYAEEKRGISLGLLSRYCRQVTYHTVSEPNRHFMSIGFPNDSGGYVLRGSGSSKTGKHNYLSGITTVSPDGEMHLKNSVYSSKCVVFEGFMDFLSFLSWKGVETPGIDVCVLNSTSMLGQAKGWVLSHEGVRSFFDNDDAGEKATRQLEGWCGELNLDFKDGRPAYSGHKDINEAWVAELSRRKGRREAEAPVFSEGKGLSR